MQKILHLLRLAVKFTLPKAGRSWIVDNILTRNYLINKINECRNFQLSHQENKCPLIVYQMGKVGSSTLVKSLKDMNNLDMDVYHVHFLTHESIRNIEKVYKHATKVYKKDIIDQHVIESLYLRKQLDQGLRDTKWKVITLVRDPIVRNISCFFEAFNQYFPDIALSYRSKNIKLENQIDDLQRLFLNNFDQEHHMPLI